MNKIRTKVIVAVSVCLYSVVSSVSDECSANDVLTTAERQRYESEVEKDTEALKTHPHDAVLYAKRGQVFKHLDKLQMGLDDLNEAIAINPSEIRFNMIRADILFLLKDWKRAILDTNKVISSGTSDPHWFDQRSSLRIKFGDNLGAIEDLSKAISLDAGDSSKFQVRAGLYAGQERFDLALKDIDKAISLNPTNEDAKSVKLEIQKIQTDCEIRDRKRKKSRVGYMIQLAIRASVNAEYLRN